jgi:hypothetical protein
MAEKARNIRKILSNKKKLANTTTISTIEDKQPQTLIKEPSVTNEIDPLTFLGSSEINEDKQKGEDIFNEIKNLAQPLPQQQEDKQLNNNETFTSNIDITPTPNTSTTIAKLLFRMKKSKELDTPTKIISNIFEAKTETTPELSSFQHSNSNINNNNDTYNNNVNLNNQYNNVTEFNTTATPHKLGPPDLTDVQKNKLMARFRSARETIQNKQLVEKDVIKRTSNKILEKAKLLGERLLDPALKQQQQQSQSNNIFKEDVNINKNEQRNEESMPFTKKRSNQDIEIFMNSKVILQEKKSFEEVILKQSSKEINTFDINYDEDNNNNIIS